MLSGIFEQNPQTAKLFITIDYVKNITSYPS